MSNLTQEDALRALQQGATILALDVPEGTEFGVDLRTYAVGPRFGHDNNTVMVGVSSMSHKRNRAKGRTPA